MFYAYINHQLFEIKSLAQFKSREVLDWFIAHESARGYDVHECSKEEAVAIANEMGNGRWLFDVCKTKDGRYKKLPYRYWSTF